MYCDRGVPPPLSSACVIPNSERISSACVLIDSYAPANQLTSYPNPATVANLFLYPVDKLSNVIANRALLTSLVDFKLGIVLI